MQHTYLIILTLPYMYFYVEMQNVRLALLSNSYPTPKVGSMSTEQHANCSCCLLVSSVSRAVSRQDRGLKHRGSFGVWWGV